MLKNDTCAEKVVPRISTFFFFRKIFAPRSFGRFEKKGKEKPSKSEEIRLPIFSVSFG